MNTATTRIRAGAPALQLHRAQPIDFVMTDEEEREVCDGFERAMRAPIPKPEHVETASVEDTAAASVAWVGYVLIAAAVALISFAAGIVSVRLLP